jgi:hypothetical protein
MVTPISKNDITKQKQKHWDPTTKKLIMIKEDLDNHKIDYDTVDYWHKNFQL